MAYCTKCGKRTRAGVLFCTHCGAPVETEAQPSAPDVPAEPAMPASPQPASATPWQDTPAVVPQQVAAGTKSGCMPTVLVVLGMLALLAALGIGGLVYAGYKMKQKATAFLRKTIPRCNNAWRVPGRQPRHKQTRIAVRKSARRCSADNRRPHEHPRRGWR